MVSRIESLYRRPSEFQKVDFAHLKPYDRTISYQDPKGEFLITKPSLAAMPLDLRSNTVVSNSERRLKEKSISQNKPLDVISEDSQDGFLYSKLTSQEINKSSDS